MLYKGVSTNKLFDSVNYARSGGCGPTTSGVTGGGQGGRVPPQRLLTGKFLLTYREKRGKEKGGKGWKLRRKGGKLETEAGKRQKKRWGPFFFFFFFLLFTFENDENLFWVYQNGNFLPGKNISGREKKSGKMTLPPQKNMPVTPLPTTTENSGASGGAVP